MLITGWDPTRLRKGCAAMPRFRRSILLASVVLLLGNSLQAQGWGKVSPSLLSQLWDSLVSVFSWSDGGGGLDPLGGDKPQGGGGLDPLGGDEPDGRGGLDPLGGDDDCAEEPCEG